MMTRVNCSRCGYTGLPNTRGYKADFSASRPSVIGGANPGKESFTRTFHCAKCDAQLTESAGNRPDGAQGKLAGRLVPTCASCGASLPENASSCPSCGNPRHAGR
jgi:ribosomal protein L40E